MEEERRNGVGVSNAVLAEAAGNEACDMDFGGGFEKALDGSETDSFAEGGSKTFGEAAAVVGAGTEGTCELGAEPKGEASCEAKDEGELGKFKDSKQLLSAYNALLSEFTKRCQKLKMLEARVNTFESTNAGAADEGLKLEDVLSDEELVDNVILGDVRVYKRAIARYLNEMSLSSGMPTLQRGGFSALTPVKRPKSLADAKKLADLMLRK